MPNPNIAQDGESTRFKLGVKRKPKAVTPEMLAARLDTALYRELGRCIRANEPLPPHVVTGSVSRVKDLGQTKPPTPPEPTKGSGDDSAMAAIREALGAQSGSVAPPSMGAAPSGPSERGGG